MITQAFLSLGLGFLGWVGSLFPAWTPPQELVHFGATFNSWVAGFTGMGVWAPWALITVCLSISLGAWLVGAGAKLLRAVASYLPFIGGAG